MGFIWDARLQIPQGDFSEASQAPKSPMSPPYTLKRKSPKPCSWLAGNEGMRALYIPFKGLYRVPHSPFPTKQQ